MSSSTSPLLPAIVFDFDGTVCIGDAPVWAYAEAVIATALDGGQPADAGIRAQLGAFLDGVPGSPAYIDGYAAVAAISADVATAEQLQEAYLATRRALADGALSVAAPAGLADFLDGIAGRAERVLVTNAPAEGIAETLAALGLGERFDRIVTDAGKPAGWSAVLPLLTTERPASQLLSVGDIWSNDLSEPLAAGAATALVDRFGHRAGPAHLVAAALEELYPAFEEWLADPAAFLAAHPASAHPAPAGTAHAL